MQNLTQFLDDRARRYEGYDHTRGGYRSGQEIEPEQRMESATNWLLILVVAVAVGVVAVWVWAG